MPSVGDCSDSSAATSLYRSAFKSVAAVSATTKASRRPRGALADVNPTFNWVRLAQRVPVRVALDPAPQGILLVAGRTATATVNSSSDRRSSGSTATSVRRFPVARLHAEAGQAPPTAIVSPRRLDCRLKRLIFHVLDCNLRIVDILRSRRWMAAGARLPADGGPDPRPVGRPGQDQSAAEAVRLV